MRLQEAIDMAHDVREHFPHLEPHLVEMDHYRDGTPRIVVGLWRLRSDGGGIEYGSEGVLMTISSPYDYSRALRLLQVMNPAPVVPSRCGYPCPL